MLCVCCLFYGQALYSCCRQKVNAASSKCVEEAESMKDVRRLPRVASRGQARRARRTERDKGAKFSTPHSSLEILGFLGFSFFGDYISVCYALLPPFPQLPLSRLPPPSTLSRNVPSSRLVLPSRDSPVLLPPPLLLYA